jgi:hypothetical protein
MAEISKPTKAQIARVIDLMEETETDLIGVIKHVILETNHFNLDDAEVLAWFPQAFIDEALVYLRHRKTEQEDEEDKD